MVALLLEWGDSRTEFSPILALEWLHIVSLFFGPVFNVFNIISLASFSQFSFLNLFVRARKYTRIVNIVPVLFRVSVICHYVARAYVLALF